MACRLIALDKRPWVRPVGIGEMLRRAIAKLVIRTAGDQAKAVCGSLQLCAGLLTGVEGVTHAVAQRQQERHAQEPGGRADEGPEGSEDESAVATSGTEKEGEAATVVGI